MPRITFKRNTLPHEHGRDYPGYKAGETVDLPGGSCDRWKSRGAAVDATPEQPKPAPVAAVLEASRAHSPSFTPAPAAPSRADEGLRVMRRHDGQYDVLDQNDKVINAKPLDKVGATKLAKGGA